MIVAAILNVSGFFFAVRVSDDIIEKALNLPDIFLQILHID